MGIMAPMNHQHPSSRGSSSGRASDETSSEVVLATNLNNVGTAMFSNGNFDASLSIFRQSLEALRIEQPSKKSTSATDEEQQTTTPSASARKAKRGLPSRNKLAVSFAVVNDDESSSTECVKGPSPKRRRRQQRDKNKSEGEEDEASSSRQETAEDNGEPSTPPPPAPITPLSNMGMYREEEDDDRGTVVFNDPIRLPSSSSSSSSTYAAAVITYNLALSYQSMGSKDDALVNFERSLSLLLQTSADQEGTTTTLLIVAVLNNIGGIHFQAGQTDLAMRCFARALRDGRRKEGEEEKDEDVNTTVSTSISSLFGRIATTSQEEASSSLTSSQYLLHQSTTLSNIGQLHFRSSNFTSSMTVCDASSAIRRHVLSSSCVGVVHEESIDLMQLSRMVASVEYNMGLIAHKLGNVNQASRHYSTFLIAADRPVNEGGVGDDNAGLALIATARHQVGLAQGAQGMTDAAIATLTGVLDLRREIYSSESNSNGGDHAEIAKTLFSIGQVHFELGNFAKAMDYFTQTLRSARTSTNLKPNHMIFVFTYSYVGQILHAKGRHSEALAVYEEALNVATKVFGETHYIVINILNVIGNLRLASNEYGAASTCFARASGCVVQSLLVKNDESGRGVVVTRCRKRVAASA